MASHVPCKKNDTNGYVFYVSLKSQADTRVFQANPTLAAGDIKVAVDDAAPVNVNAQAVDGDFTKRVKITLSQAQTNGDNLTVICSDAAGGEWCDLTINIQTSAQTLNELDTIADGIKAVTDVESGVKAAVDALNDFDPANDDVAVVTDVTNEVTADAVKISGSAATADAVEANIGNLNATVSSRSSHTAANVWSVATRALTDKADFALSTAAIQAIWDKATSGLTTAGSIGKLLVDNINATISSRSSHAASAIWSVAARALTDKAGFSISGTKTTLDALNDITAASVWAVGTRTLTSFGALAQDIWDKATSALTTAGSIGKLLVDNINATISSRSSHADPTSAIVGSPGKTNQEVYDHERGTDSAYTGTPPTVAQIADQVWDELQAGHTIASSFGKYLDTEVSGVVGGGTPATIADAVWDELKAAHAISGSFGAVLALEETLTAMKGAGFITTEDSLRMIRQYIDQLESGEKPPSKANFSV